METRSASRIEVKLKVSCKIHENFCRQFGLACGENFELTALDISEAGIGVISKYFLPKGLTLNLEISGVPFYEGTMSITGEIRYCIFKKNSGYRCGIKFLDIKEEYRKCIAKLVQSYEQRQFPRIKLSG